MNDFDSLLEEHVFSVTKFPPTCVSDDGQNREAEYDRGSKAGDCDACLPIGLCCGNGQKKRHREEGSSDHDEAALGDPFAGGQVQAIGRVAHGLKSSRPWVYLQGDAR